MLSAYPNLPKFNPNLPKFILMKPYWIILLLFSSCLIAEEITEGCDLPDDEEIEIRTPGL